MTKLLDALDFQKNEIQNAVLQNLASDPGTPVNGQIFYVTSASHGVRVYINGSFQTLATMADVTAGGISSAIADAKGDLIVGTGADAVARKAVGANNTFLSPNSANGDGLEWRTLVDGDIPATIARDSEVTSAISTHAGLAVMDGDAAGGDLSGTYPNPSIAAGVIVNADVNASAAIARSKLDFGSGLVNADIAAAAAIAYSKLALSNSIVNADIGAAAAIAYSKLALSNSIVNADISSSAAIAATKIAFSPAQNIAATTVQAAIEEVVTDLTASITAVSEAKQLKDPVRVWTTANIALTGTQTIDGEALTAGMRVGVKDQTTQTENGIYVVAAGAWSRSADANTTAEVANMATFATHGTVGKGDQYTANAPAALGTNNLTWAKTSEGNTVYTASGAITLTGTNFDVTTGGISNTHINASAAIAYSKLNLATSIVNADIAAGAAIAKTKLAALDIVNADVNASAAIAYSKLNLAGTIVNADISGTAAIAYSKLNLAGALLAADVNATGASSGTGVVSLTRTWKAPLVGGATSEVLTHNLGTRDVQVTVVNNATPWDAVMVTWEATSTNTITIRGGANLPAGYRVVVQG